MAARWLVNSSQLNEPGASHHGGFATGYDYDQRSFVYGPECWHTGEAMRALLKIYARTRNEAWKDAAIKGGGYLATLQAQGQQSEEAGSFWGPWLGGAEELRVDSNYRCVLGLLDLYGSTGSARYLEVSRGVVDWFLERVYKGGGTHLNRYLPEKSTLGWPRSHILDEGAFLAFFDLTREETYAALHREQAEALIAASSGGGFSCMNAPRMERDPGMDQGEISARALYWHVTPLLARLAKRADGRALEVTEEVATRLASWQDDDGFILMSYADDGSAGAAGKPDGVATAMMAILWLKLREITSNEEYLPPAERALAWILEAQSTARREEVFGSFYQESTNEEGRARVLPGSLGSSYGIMACEEYLRSVSDD